MLIPYTEQAVVWTDLNGVAFDASLNQTNIKSNNNKVHSLLSHLLHLRDLSDRFIVLPNPVAQAPE